MNNTPGTPGIPGTPGTPDSSALHNSMTIAALQQMIFDRYYETDAPRGAAGTFLLLMEEVGELATAIHACSKVDVPAAARANLDEEFADVLAWLTSLANVCGVDLSQSLAKYTDPEAPGAAQGVKD